MITTHLSNQDVRDLLDAAETNVRFGNRAAIIRLCNALLDTREQLKKVEEARNGYHTQLLLARGESIE